MSEIERFAQSNEMVSKLQHASEKAKKKVTVLPANIRQIEIWLAGTLLHSNAQRSSAIANATMTEYQAATTFSEGRDTYTVFYVEKHKSSMTGRAKITVS